MSNFTRLAGVIGLSLCSASAFAQSLPSTGPVSEEELRADIAVLSDDSYGGRFPGTAGETLTAHYIARSWAAAGFVGAADAQGGWYQPVPLVELFHDAHRAVIRRANGSVIDDAVATIRAPAGGTVALPSLPVIYVGYGTDVEGNVIGDARGKIALLLAQDRPGEGAISVNQRRAALIAAGAVATLTIAPENVSRESLARSYASARMQLRGRVSAASLEGLLTWAAASDLLSNGGRDGAALLANAGEEGFTAVDTGLTAELSATTRRRDLNSYNVIARRPGRHSSAGTVLVMGHWDHLGTCRPEGAPDRICNGAVDNGSGIAVMNALARRIGAQPPLDRDVMLIATTAEEQGLLGAYHFAGSPTLPLGNIVIALNIDTVAVIGRGAPMGIVGRGTTPLDAEIDAVGRALGRTIDSDDEANPFIQRQDGWALTQAGVPAVMAGGSFSDMAALQSYLAGDYHTPNDELTDATLVGGAADDADLHIALVRHFATLSLHPRSHAGD